MEIPTYRYNIQQIRRKRTLMKRLLIGSCLFIILASSSLYSYFALHKSQPAAVLSTNLPAAITAEPVKLPWPGQGQAAIGTSDYGVLASSLPVPSAVPIASVAKVITALAVIRQKPFAVGQPGGLLKFDSEDINFYNEYVAKGGSVTPINFGQELSEYDALQAMLLPSSNNMADSLARWAFGSIDAYKVYANAMLKDYGLTHSVVDDASGFSPQTVSTAEELVLLGQKLLSNDILAGIVARREATIPVAGTVTNVNQLLTDPSVIGIKTGNTDEAGGCLLFAAKQKIDSSHEITIIGAVAGSASINTVFTDSKGLLDAARAGFGKREVIKAGTTVGKYNTVWGSSAEVVAGEALDAYGWKGSELKPELQLNRSDNARNAGQDIGRLKITSNNRSYSVSLRLKRSLPGPSPLWRLSHYF